MTEIGGRDVRFAPRPEKNRLGDNLAIQVRDPRFYKCWAGCTEEEIRAALGRPIRKSAVRRLTRYMYMGRASIFMRRCKPLEHFHYRCIADFGETLRRIGHGESVWRRSGRKHATCLWRWGEAFRPFLDHELFGLGGSSKWICGGSHVFRSISK
jgi:hypothetical protein